MLHCMAKNPEVQEKLYKEIKSVLGHEKHPTPEDLTRMPYLKGCMLESFRYTNIHHFIIVCNTCLHVYCSCLDICRMQPTGIFVTRVLENDITLMGYNIPAEV